MKKLISFLLLLTMSLGILISCGDPKPVEKNYVGYVNLSVEKDHDAVAAKMATGEIEIAILPEPKATASILAAKQEGQNYSIKLNLSTEWSKVSDTPLSMGCIIVRNSFIQNNEGALENFLKECKASIEYIGNKSNKGIAAQMIVDAAILPKLPIANSALDNLYGSIVYKDGTDMKETLTSFYDAIGIAQPTDDFYYNPKTSASSGTAKINIGVMNGPTGMGMAKLISDYGMDSDKYLFKIYSTPETATAALSAGEIDIACVPTNLAANLANKSDNFISVAAINCLGSLYVVVKDGVTINSVSDLIDRTVYYGVKTSTTEPIIRYILDKNNIGIKTEEDQK